MKSKLPNNKIVLAVDDKPDNLKVLVNYLEQSGFQLIVAQSGEEALRNVERITPDIILLDVLMPGIDGFETCLRLKRKKATKDIPVIFMTALTETVEKVKGFNVGAADFLTKPLQQEEVLARMNAHLTIREYQKTFQEKNHLLEQKNTQLTEANETKDKFFSIIAHDLKNPSSTMLSYTDTLVKNIDKLDTVQLKKGIIRLNRIAARGYNLVVDLLMWAHLHSGKMESKFEDFDLSFVAWENVELLRERAEEKGIHIVSEISEGTMVYSDKNMISTVLRNLLTNAVKFTSENGVVKVTGKNNGVNLKVTISDTGIGISEENIKKLFRLDTFYRALGTDNERGTGLGLNICKEFLSILKGEIWVESELEKGSRFIFTLPVKP